MHSRSRKKAQPRSRFTDEYGLLLNRLIAARKAAGLHQTELAERLGKVQSHVSLIELREREISFVEVFRWCEATGVRFSELASDFEDDIARMRDESRHSQSRTTSSLPAEPPGPARRTEVRRAAVKRSPTKGPDTAADR